MQLLRSHGITRDETIMSRTPDGPWYYEQQMLGFNYRMTELQGALGCSQITRLDEFVERRHQLAARYDRLLADAPVRIPLQHDDGYSGLHLYVVRVDERSRQSHRQVFDGLRAAGVGVNLHYMPVYLQPYYQTLGFKAGTCPEAENYYNQAISLPMYSSLSEADQDYVAQILIGLIA
jgi:dTDP-4-amino-4,6-dideoxygalactose transaminase